MDCKVYRFGVDSLGDGYFFCYFFGVLSKVWCLFLFLISRKVWRSMYLVGFLVVLKGREIYYLEIIDIRDFNI